MKLCLKSDIAAQMRGLLANWWLTKIVVLIFSLASLVMCGCKSNSGDSNEALKFFGITYFNYQQIWKKPPSNWNEILRLADDPRLENDRKLLLHVQKSGYVVVWGLDTHRLSESLSEIVLAYPPDALQRGGKVLMLDGSLISLSAKELNSRLTR